MKVLDVYSRQGCHLCEHLLEELLPLVRGRLDVRVHDIDTKPEWKATYGTRIPIVEYDGELVCQYHLDPDALERILSRLPA
jgi:predicted thioredoxin/glutaredoxin